MTSEPTEKACTKCGRVRSIDDFYWKTAKGRKYRQSWCKSCCNELTRQYHQEHLEYCRAQNREGHRRRWKGDPDYHKKKHGRAAEGDPFYNVKNGLRHNFKLTWDGYQAMVEAQQGACASCHRPPEEGKRLEVDHDRGCCPGSRSCGKCIRGLLCRPCNGGTGIADDPVLLRAKARYLLDWQERHPRAR